MPRCDKHLYTLVALNIQLPYKARHRIACVTMLLPRCHSSVSDSYRNVDDKHTRKMLFTGNVGCSLRTECNVRIISQARGYFGSGPQSMHRITFHPQRDSFPDSPHE